jgi:hypothetical protein
MADCVQAGLDEAGAAQFVNLPARAINKIAEHRRADNDVRCGPSPKFRERR